MRLYKVTRIRRSSFTVEALTAGLAHGAVRHNALIYDGTRAQIATFSTGIERRSEDWSLEDESREDRSQRFIWHTSRWILVALCALVAGVSWQCGITYAGPTPVWRIGSGIVGILTSVGVGFVFVFSIVESLSRAANIRLAVSASLVGLWWVVRIASSDYSPCLGAWARTGQEVAMGGGSLALLCGVLWVYDMIVEDYRFKETWDPDRVLIDPMRMRKLVFDGQGHLYEWDDWDWTQERSGPKRGAIAVADVVNVPLSMSPPRP